MTDENVEQIQEGALNDFLAVASQGPVAELTPQGLLVTLFIPWDRIGSVQGVEENE